MVVAKGLPVNTHYFKCYCSIPTNYSGISRDGDVLSKQSNFQQYRLFHPVAVLCLWAVSAWAGFAHRHRRLVQKVVEPESLGQPRPGVHQAQSVEGRDCPAVPPTAAASPRALGAGWGPAV